MYRKVVWSPVEIEYLAKHISDPINQLSIALAKSRGAIEKRIKEIKTGKPAEPKKKNGRRSKIGKRADCENKFFRSGWEANCYRLFRTMDEIKKIEYEPQDFTFWQFGIKKGTVTYTPDFRLTYKSGEVVWVEVKGGFMKPTDKTKIRRFKKYYPQDFDLLVAVTPGLTSKTAAFFEEQGVPIRWVYPELNKLYKNTIPGWE